MNISANIALGKVSLGKDIHSTVESCCVNLLRDQLSHLQENYESMCLPHSQWSTKRAHTGIMYMVITWVGQNNCQGQDGYFYLLCIFLYNYPLKMT